jgi:predicted transglutaminase-like cysteine proteinase
MGHQMKIKTAVGAAILGVSMSASLAFGLDTASRSPVGPAKSDSATEYDKTLPPVGFVKFCASNPQDCKADGKLAMSPDRWNQLYQVNSYVNGKIAPVSDKDLYGEAEYWTYPVDAGDCEDYVLLKKRYLESLGFPATALLITVVLDEKSEGHAVLTVATDGGDFVLDNRRDDILRWNDTKYTFLKRQTTRDPMRWVALSKQKAEVTGFMTKGAGR